MKNLQSRWIKSGVQEGDTLLLHSSLKRTISEFSNKKKLVRPEDVLNSLIDVVGKKGTLVFPTFNFDFTKGAPFDYYKTKSQMGVLTEIARLHPKAIRTGHPIYSFVVIGYKSSEFSKVDNISAYSEESPFGIVKNLNGKIGVLDLEDQNSMTYYHHIEEVNKVKYRFFKDFSGIYTDSKNNSKMKTYKIYVRDTDKGVLTDVNPAGELLWKAGLYSGYRPMTGSGLRLINSQKMFKFITNIIKDKKALGILYSLEKK